MKPHFTFFCLVISACAARGSIPQQFSTDKPDRLYVESQERRFNFQLHRVLTGVGEGWFKEEHGEYWSDGNGGNGENLHTVISQPLSEPPSTDVCHQTFDWAASSWPELVDATLVKSPLACDSFWGTGGHPLIDKTYCDIPANKFDQYFPGDWIHTECSWHTETKMSLYTGGKALPRRMNLFVLTGSATEITEKYTPPVYGSKSYRPIANTKVVIGELGPLGSDGRLYSALPDGETKDVTPRVKNKNYYSFLLGHSKHKLKIYWNEDITDKLSTTIVGRKTALQCGFEPTISESFSCAWSIPGETVKRYDQVLGFADSYTVLEKLQPTDCLSNPIVFFWIDGGTKLPLECRATVQDAVCNSKTWFTVNRPSGLLWSKTTTNVPPILIVGSNGEDWLQYGIDINEPGYDGIYLYFAVITPTNGAGQFGYLQTVNTTHRWRYVEDSPKKGYATNAVDVFNGVIRGLTPLDDSDSKTNSFGDSPGDLLNSDRTWVYANDSFAGYLLYRPTGADTDRIWVTLRRIDWNWEGAATKIFNEEEQSSYWRLDAGYSPPPQDPTSYNSTELPTWSRYVIPLTIVPDN